MATTVKELREWLKRFDENELVAIDEGGLTLEAYEEDSDVYLEIGGWPLEEDDDE